MAIVSFGERGGVVSTFDDARGLGEITADGDVYPFHCTAIAGGSLGGMVPPSLAGIEEPAGAEPVATETAANEDEEAPAKKAE